MRDGLSVSNRRRRRSDILIHILRILCVVLILIGVIMLVKIWEDKSIRDSQNPSAGSLITPPERVKDTVNYNGKNYVLRDDLETVLIIGYDKNSDSNAEDKTSDFSQADLVFLVVVDKANGKYHTLHVNRDTMTNVKVLTDNGVATREFTGQIALSYAYGGTEGIRCRNTVDSLSAMLGGIRINHYVSVGMDSVAALNDSVGGVTLEVMDDIDDGMKKGQTLTLTGDQALRYVRARDHVEADANLHRMERQKQYLSEFRKVFSSKASDDAGFVLSELLMLGNHMYSDCTVEALADIVNNAVKLEGSDYLTLAGENRMGEEFVEFYPDETALKDMTIKLFYKEQK